MPDHVTYRIPKSSVALVEKLFAAYQVSYEELGPEQIFTEAMNLPIESVKDVPMNNLLLQREQSFLKFMTTQHTVWPDSYAVTNSPGPSLDESSGANQILRDRFYK